MAILRPCFHQDFVGDLALVAVRDAIAAPASWSARVVQSTRNQMTQVLDKTLPVLRRPLVLIGMMGAGKTTIGRRLAERLEAEFVDADREIEAAAGRSIPEIFEEFGEAHFRDGERRVIARLLEAEPFILATGGGAFMDEETRALIATQATSLWLRADLDLLWARVSKRSHRPLLHTENPRQTLADLVERRYPVYAQADLVVDSLDGPKDDTVNACIDALRDASL